MNGNEHRTFSRASTQMQVRLFGADGEEVVGCLCDVSLNGVYVTCNSRLPEKGRCRLQLRLSEDVCIEAEGCVARLTDAGMAIALDGVLGVEAYQHLKRLVLFNSPDPERVLKETQASLGIKPRSA